MRDGHMMVRSTLLAVAVLAVGGGPGALAQARADGRYPALLSCDKLPFTSGPVRDPFVLEITSGKASYSRKLTNADAPDASGSSEAGTGTLAGGRLSLTGRASWKGSSFDSRYVGEVNGQGGLMSGIQSWTYKGKSYDRRCQISVGNGRG